MLPDGTVISSNTPISEKNDFTNVLAENGIYKAIILNTWYRDSKNNKSKKFTEYHVRIVGGELFGREFPNVQATDGFGSPVNFNEKVYSQKSKKIKSNTKDGNDSPPEVFNNAYVMISFLNGDTPIITGAWPHSNKKVNNSSESTAERLLGEFNGIRWHINKEGEFIFTYTGGIREDNLETEHPTGKYSGTEPVQIKIDKTGSISILDKECEEIKMDRANKKITITQYADTLDNESDADYQDSDISPSGAIVNQVTLDKTNNKIIINSDNVELGDATLEYICKSKLVTDYINNVIRATYESHTHLANLGFPTSTPSAPNDTMTIATEVLLASQKHKTE